MSPAPLVTQFMTGTEYRQM